MTQYRFIRFERSGGFAGLTFTFDEHSMKDEEADQIQKLIEQSGLAEISPVERQQRTLTDQFTYSLVFTTGKKQQTIILREAEVPEALRPLIQYLSKKARKKTNR